MDVCEENYALPFDVYQKFLESLKGTNRKMYDYLGRLNFLIKDEKEYESAVSKAVWPYKDLSSYEWGEIAENWRFTHLANIDFFCSELELLSNPVVKSGTILFGGCGNGDIAEWIRENTDAEMVCIDLSSKMLKEYKEFKPGAVYVRGDCKELPFRNETFNQYFTTGVIDERSCDELMREAGRVLVPGGEVRMDGVVGHTMKLPIDIRNYGDFIRFFVKRYENPIIKNLMTQNIGKAYLIRELQAVENAGLEADCKFSRSPSLPRYSPMNNRICPVVISEYETPFVVIGKKPKTQMQF